MQQIFEADTVQRLIRRWGVLPAKGSIEDLVSPDTWARTKPFLAPAGIPEDYARQMEPWVLSMALTQATVVELGYDSEHGVDLDFLRRARGSKPIAELESAKSQIALFDDMDANMQELMLIDTLESIADMASYLSRLMEYWQSGDDDGVSMLFQEGHERRPELAPLYDVVITQRNIAMSDRIEAMMREGGSYFVVVGALHVVGESGIVATLVERGFEAERIATD